eukprot:Rhum_TRINITY_DN14673_c15_g3::Rhum_TRINITY_DN14673_c15_g3_i1::g.108188::m.108188
MSDSSADTVAVGPETGRAAAPPSLAPPLLTQVEVETLRASVQHDLQAWAAVGCIPEADYQALLSSAALLPADEQAAARTAADGIPLLPKSPQAPPLPTLPAVPAKRCLDEEEVSSCPKKVCVGSDGDVGAEAEAEAEAEVAAPAARCLSAGRATPAAPFVGRPCDSVGRKVDGRKLRELEQLGGAAGLLSAYVSPLLRVRSVAFVCAVNPVPEYTDDEASEASADAGPVAGGEGDVGEDDRCVAFDVPEEGGGASPPRLVVLCADYTDFTPKAWVTTLELDGVVVQHMAMSVNGHLFATPPNWDGFRNASDDRRYKTFVPACVDVPLTGGESACFSVQFVGSSSRCCLVGVWVESVSVAECCDKIVARSQGGQGSGPASPASAAHDVEASVTLRCPLTHSLIAVPARGNTCEHRECFDLASFLQLAFSTNLWACPICAVPLPPACLSVDCELHALLKDAASQRGSAEAPDRAWVSAAGWSLPPVAQPAPQTEQDIIVLE